MPEMGLVISGRNCGLTQAILHVFLQAHCGDFSLGGRDGTQLFPQRVCAAQGERRHLLLFNTNFKMHTTEFEKDQSH